MKLIRRILFVVTLLLAGATVAPAAARQEPPIEQQGEFVPAGDLPQREQVPAAPLLIGAYAFVLLALFAYVISVSRRIGAVQADMLRLEGEIKRGSRA
jgi:hypothetical protein